jgi:hypothetical protein
MITWITQNLGMILGVIAGGGGIAGAVKSFRWPRSYERVVVTRGTNLVMDKNKPDQVREYTGFIFRPIGFYRMAVVNIRDRLDNVLIEVMRPAGEPEHPDTPTHRENWILAATIEWHVIEGKVHDACEWKVNPIEEFVRGEVQDAVLNVLENTPVTMNLNTAGIFQAALPEASVKLLDHGVKWTKFMVNKNALAPAEIQGQAIRKIAKAIEKSVAAVLGRNYADGQIVGTVEKWVSTQFNRGQSTDTVTDTNNVD